MLQQLTADFRIGGGGIRRAADLIKRRGTFGRLCTFIRQPDHAAAARLPRQRHIVALAWQADSAKPERCAEIPQHVDERQIAGPDQIAAASGCGHREVAVQVIRWDIEPALMTGDAEPLAQFFMRVRFNASKTNVDVNVRSERRGVAHDAVQFILNGTQQGIFFQIAAGHIQKATTAAHFLGAVCGVA